MTSTMAKGFVSLNLTGVPEGVQASLKNPQVITDTGALSAIVAQAPPEQAEAVRNAVEGAKNVLNSGISNVFIFCGFIAIAGIVASLFFKGAPMKIVHLGEPENTPPTSCSEAEGAE
jgi:hypothetical protein